MLPMTALALTMTCVEPNRPYVEELHRRIPDATYVGRTEARTPCTVKARSAANIVELTFEEGDFHLQTSIHCGTTSYYYNRVVQFQSRPNHLHYRIDNRTLSSGWSDELFVDYEWDTPVLIELIQRYDAP